MPLTAGPDTRPHRRVYRSVTTVWTVSLMTVGLLGLIVLAVLPGRAQIVGIIFAPIWALITWRFWKLGVYAEGDGIKIVGAVVSRRVAWEEIDHFEVAKWLRFPYQGFVVLKADHSSIPIEAIGEGPKGEQRRRRAEKPIDELNEALAEWRRFGRVKNNEPADPAPQQG